MLGVIKLLTLHHLVVYPYPSNTIVFHFILRDRMDLRIAKSAWQHRLAPILSSGLVSANTNQACQSAFPSPSCIMCGAVLVCPRSYTGIQVSKLWYIRFTEETGRSKPLVRLWFSCSIQTSYLYDSQDCRP
ncbi:hypothetical protein PISMIDRAFT_179710 [Pisolithus microcarpus 441]|uniref:Uncharacterized protein n=1 Tax=Pisolithus microcarpus 441 TaxID=765257 RepID=A0A0C9YPV9_9AGAM|nr:hypothetical protein PISMIDRAFT_179710 [Pisolithus microcarpus 441]